MESCKVLLVDNDDNFRKILRKTLEKHRYSVEDTNDGRAARDLMKLADFDLVISDIEMPHLTGTELLEWSKLNKPVPMILMTGFTQLLDVKSAYEMGAAGFLTKPFDEKSLLEELKKVPYKNKPGDTASESSPAPAPKPAPPEEYCKILIDDFTSGSKIPFSIYIRVSDTKYIKIAHTGEDVSLQQIKSYKSKGVDCLYIAREDYCKLVGFNLKLSKAISNKKIDPAIKLKFMKYTGETIAQNLFVADINKEAFDDSAEFVKISLDVISEDASAVLMLEVLNSHADFVYAHSLGVSIYGVMLAKKLGWLSPHTAFKVSLAGLYHDIGKKEIPRAILEKPRPLMTAEERKIYETHPTRGKEILEFLKSLPSEVLEVAYQHHENDHGTGFPRALEKNEIYPLASLIGVVNRFCELVIKSPVAEGMSAKAAIDLMENRWPGEFRKEYLDALKSITLSSGKK